MQDRELLELAAKAAGLEYECTSHTFYSEDDQHQVRDSSGALVNWSPLKDDGDALRLAIDLDIHIKTVSGSAVSSAGYAVNEIRMDYIHEPHGSDKHAATRRAIVRAAASIGKNT